MKGAISALLLWTLALSAAPQATVDLPPRTRSAIQTLKAGMSEADVVALLRPLSLESGRVTYGGTGSGRVYFRVSETQQLRVEVTGGPTPLVREVGPIEPLGIWKHDYHAGLIVLPPKQPVTLAPGLRRQPPEQAPIKMPAAPPSAFPEPAPFRIVPTAASEPLMFDGYDVFFAWMAEWRGSTLYVFSTPVECERSRVSLTEPYSFSAEVFHPRIRFLYTRATASDALPPTQPSDGKFNFNIGYQF